MDEEWEKYHLEEIAERITEKVGNRKLTTLSISAGVGFVSQAEKFSRDISGKQYVNYIFVKKGDFSYNKGNSKRFPQGCIYELTEFEEGAAPNAFLSFRFKDGFVKDFYKGYFDNNFHGKQLLRFITSGARSDGLLNINPTDFFSIVLPTPKDTAEQQKVADCLTSIDDLIAAEGKKLEALKMHKKGLMQKIFSNEIRFLDKKGRSFPEWTKEKFGDTLESIIDNRGKTPEVVSSGIPLIEVGAIGNFHIDYSKIKKYVSDEVFENWFRKHLKHGDVLFSTVGRIGLCSYYDESDIAAVAQNVVGLRFLKDYNSIFMLYLLTEISNSKYIQSIVMSAVQPSIKVTQLTELVFLIPSLPEQQKIADFLLSLDELISIQIQKIEVLRSHKKGIMQGLFPSIEVVSE